MIQNKEGEDMFHSIMSTKHVDIFEAGKLHHATKQQIRKPDVIVNTTKP